MKSIEIAAYIAALVFNEGHSATLLLMKILELHIGPTCKLTVDGRDQRRLSQQTRATAKESKEARTIARMERIKKNELFGESEGLMYAPGNCRLTFF